MYKEYLEQPLDQFLSDFPELASILYFYGIDYNANRTLTLSKICSSYDIPTGKIIKKIGKSYDTNTLSEISSLPLPIILEYLKQAHKNYIKYKIPFCLDIVKRLKTTQETLGDIKFIFPVFAEDFVSHILDEEKTLFKQISKLVDIQKKGYPAYEAFLFYESNSILQEQKNHLNEDEFKGFRELTNNYNKENCSNLEELILISELELFDQDIQKHAVIENKLLFPKAALLLNEIKTMLNSLSANN